MTAAVALALGGTAVARADGFGGFEAAYTHDDNFMGAPAGATKTSNNLMTYSGYVGNYWPSANDRSAWVLRADGVVTRLDQFNVFNNTAYGLNTGFFHAFSRGNSMVATVGAHADRFSDPARNFNVYNLQLGFRQAAGDISFVREGLLLEKAGADVSENRYNGAGLNASLNWTPSRSSLISLGLGGERRNYDVTAGNERTSVFATLGFVQQIGQSAYVRAGVTRAKDRTNAGVNYYDDLYTVGLGVSL